MLENLLIPLCLPNYVWPEYRSFAPPYSPVMGFYYILLTTSAVSWII